MIPSDAISAAITRLRDRIDAQPVIREATMKSANSVRFDTDTADTIIRGNLASGVASGARVLTLKLKHYVWVLGQAGGGDTGWVNVTVNSGYAAQGSEVPQVRRIGKVVHARWGWSNTGVTPSSSHIVGVIPEGFRPSQSVYFRWGTNSAASVAGGVVYSSGSVEIRTPPSTAPLSNAAYYLFPGLTWLID